LRLRARLDDAPAPDERERVDAGNVQGRDPAGAAQQLDQEATILGSDPPGAELDVGAGTAVDVRDVPAVAQDPEPWAAGPLGADGALAAEPERSPFEEVEEVTVRDASGERRQPVVELQLVERMRADR